ncbi:hypothetical protein, variant [Exophiala xenobiotica]|uniref:Uncharacterized protein n=1 Tax=Exophiala xenobiotica TaxID=348802 RepID=A0A0D2CP54_9EURO|nr:hypothetical protein, variant [Exophiala xenobiotica]XP_013312311.1 uncharacterized protein PV05_10416 [Exophiala xenobiotica]KIW51726.1 hypothetical protein PV05_10416 [Exophiala xenobiotica]KIW51727.1 hypothetical protein, variant [Exophiala xenobiotica]
MSTFRLPFNANRTGPPNFLPAHIDTYSASSHAVLRDKGEHRRIELPGSSTGLLGETTQAFSGTSSPFAPHAKARKLRSISGQVEVPPSKSKKKAVFIWQCCQDGKSAISIKTEHCPTCSHARCNNCRLQKITQ